MAPQWGGLAGICESARGESRTRRGDAGANEKSETRRWANSSLTCTFSSAPTGTRTQTVRILSPLPLPIGLWGPRLMLETGPAYP